MGDLPQKLLGNPPLLEGESLASFLTRVGKDNFYQPPSILTELILEGIGDEADRKDRTDLPRQAAVFERIWRLTQVACLQLYEASAHHFALVLTPPGSEISTLKLPGNHLVPLLPQGTTQKLIRSTSACQYCPVCVQQHPYHRLIWHLVATSVCLEHKCLLTNTCYNCNEKVRVQDIVNSCCSRCGVDLAKAPCILIESDELGLLSQQVLQGWLLNIPMSLPSADYLPPHPPRVLFYLVEGLRFTVQRLASSGWPYLHTLPQHDTLAMPFKTDSHTLTPYQSFCVYTTAMKGIFQWPKGFRKFLDAQQSHGSKDARVGNVKGDLGSLYTHWFQRRWQHPSFDFVQDTFNLYIAEHYGISLSILHSDRFRRNPGLLRGFSYVSINYAAELAGVTPSTIQRLIDSGQLETTKEVPTMVRQTDVLKLRDAWNFYMGLEEATQVLGVSEDVILDMVDIGLISPEQSPNTGFLSWKFSEKELCLLLDKMRKHAKTYSEFGTANVPTVSLASAARMLTKVGLNAASIIAHVADGKVLAYRQSNEQFSCRDLVFEHKDINAYVKAILAEKGWMSRKDVTRYLKIKDGTLVKWVKAGLLVPNVIHANTQYYDRVTVEKFAADHVTSEGAAELIGVGMLTVQKWVRQGRLQAVSGPGIDEHHDYLFNKTYLLRWRDGRLSFGQAMDLLGVSAATLHRWVYEGKILPLDDMGGKQRWFSREVVLGLRLEIGQKFIVPVETAAFCSSPSVDPMLGTDSRTIA